MMVTTNIYNLILSKLYCDHHGTMHIRGNREYSCKLKFKEQSILDRNPHQKLPPTDSRLRPDQRHLENGEYEKANAEKKRLERRQRMVRMVSLISLGYTHTHTPT
ncbi:putative oxysterol-binding protein [Rosa chinensis]|uniref:Putative oxysterol-binding protein n=1 Tax=Rosa chinensis TaxID=74649 RepID=A0A2P6RSN5_ROSCH|nr:putative oxysterol-binding protein [Rosa chinensis]